MDSTLLVNPDFDISHFEKDFFTFKHGLETDFRANHNIAKFRWTSFCMSAKKGNKVISYVKNFLIKYVINEKHIVDYFLVDYALNSAYEVLPDFRTTIDELPILITYEDMFFLDINFKKDYNNDLWEKVKRRTPIIKTTYKHMGQNIRKGTYLDYFYKNKLKW